MEPSSLPAYQAASGVAASGEALFGEAAPGATALGEAAPAISGASRILIVDDSRTQSALLKRLLSEHGYEVMLAHDGSQGLDAAHEFRPRLVISDIVMPILDGYAMCEALKRDPQGHDTPVVLLTMLSDPQDIVLGLQAGADYYLTKPCDDEYLLSTVAAILEQPLGPPEPPTPPLEIIVGDHRHKISAGRRQMFNLLLSTYGNAVQQNRALLRAQHDLQTLNAQLLAQRRQIEAQQRELEEANGRLRVLATRDGLTGLHNRRTFGERLDEEFARARRHNTPLSLLLLDVDRFKEYNDTFGHPAGDEVLRVVARVMEASARRGDFPARYGGEEFAVVLPQTDPEAARVVAERLRVALAAVPWDKRLVTASIGIATATAGDYTEPAALLAASDAALYASKAGGRNRVTHAVDMAVPSDLGAVSHSAPSVSGAVTAPASSSLSPSSSTANSTPFSSLPGARP